MQYFHLQTEAVSGFIFLLIRNKQGAVYEMKYCALILIFEVL